MSNRYKTNADIFEIQQQAREASLELLDMKDSLREMIQGDKQLRKDLDAIDKSFTRKLFGFPGDITFARIEKVFSKLMNK